MIRSLILFFLPLILPLIFYMIGISFMKKVAKKEHLTLEKSLKSHVTWLWLIAAGITLLAITLSIWGLSDPIPPTQIYSPPYFDSFENAINPGHFDQ